MWIEATYVPIRDEAGDLQEIVVFLRDVTDRRLRAADEGGQIAAIGVSPAVVHFALDGTILDANDDFLQLTVHVLLGQGARRRVRGQPPPRRRDAVRHQGRAVRALLTPRFIAKDRVFKAVEAQVELNHPERGRLTAPAFMPLAESSGLVVPLRDWVLRAACKAAAQWPMVAAGIPTSSAQLFSSDLPGAVALALRETGLPPSRLELQIARGLGRFDLERIRTDLATLRDMGVRVVVEGQLVGEDLTSGRVGWPLDYVAIDPKTRSDLTRPGPASVAEIVRLEAARGLGTRTGEEDASIRDILSLRLDRNAQLEPFLNAEARSADAIRLLLVEAA